MNQEFEFYGVPSVSFAYEDAKWQAVSKSTYSFKKNEKLFEEVLQEKIKLKEIPKKEEAKFKKELKISESERYFHRDVNAEPYWYTFMIDSTHFLTSKELFILAIQLIINKLEIFINELPKLSINEKTFMTIESMKEDSIFLLIIH